MMDRGHDSDLVELGTASLDTHGAPVGFPPEAVGFFEMGLEQ
jgi:hypothetical protein